MGPYPREWGVDLGLGMMEAEGYDSQSQDRRWARSGEWWGTIVNSLRKSDEADLRRQGTGRIHVPVEQIYPTPSLARLIQPRVTML